MIVSDWVPKLMSTSKHKFLVFSKNTIIVVPCHFTFIVNKDLW